MVVAAVRVIHGPRIGEAESKTTKMVLIKARQEEYKKDLDIGESKTHQHWCPSRLHIPIGFLRNPIMELGFIPIICQLTSGRRSHAKKISDFRPNTYKYRN